MVPKGESQLLSLECVLVFWKKGKQAFTAVSVERLSPFLSAARGSPAQFIEVGFLLFRSYFLISSLLQFFLIFFF